MSLHEGMDTLRVLKAPGCYERTARAERKSALQGSGLVRTVGLCAQEKVALMPQAIATARDTFCQTISAKAPRVSRGRLDEQALVLANKASSEARGKVCSLSYLSVVR